MFNHLIPDCFNLILKELDIRSLKNYGVCSKESYTRSKQVKTEYKEKYWDNIKEIKKQAEHGCYSTRDFAHPYTTEDFAIYNNKQLTFKETIILKQLLHEGRFKTRKKYVLPYNPFVVYRTLKQSNVYNKIICCYLYVSDHIVDRIYGSIMKTLNYIYGITDESVIPFYFSRYNCYIPTAIQSPIEIYIEFEHDVEDELTIDVYNITEPFKDDEVCVIPISITNNCGPFNKEPFRTNDKYDHNTNCRMRLNSSTGILSNLIFKVHTKDMVINNIYIRRDIHPGISLKNTYTFDGHDILYLSPRLDNCNNKYGISLENCSIFYMNIECQMSEITFDIYEVIGSGIYFKMHHGKMKVSYGPRAPQYIFSSNKI